MRCRYLPGDGLHNASDMFEIECPAELGDGPFEKFDRIHERYVSEHINDTSVSFLLSAYS